MNESLISEPIQAWKYGPVIPTLYENLKVHGSRRVVDNVQAHSRGQYFYSRVAEDEVEDLLFLNKIWEVYSQYTGTQLSAMTHAEGTPWDQVTKAYREMGNDIPLGLEIPNKLIKQHYDGKVVTTA